jgi:ferredoxin
LASVVGELESRIHAPLALEGLSVRGDEIVLLGLIPHDERLAGYTLGYGFALSAIDIAERHGGRAYGTGVYFSGRADRILGAEKVEVLKESKRRNDPSRILNPGKVHARTAIGATVNMAAVGEPLVRTLANQFGRPMAPAERAATDREILPDVAGYAYACAQCGYCVDICPQFQEEGGWESSGPRGKWFLLKGVLEGREHLDAQMRDIIGLCVQCGKCDEVCQLELPMDTSWRKLKDSLFQGILTRTS